MTLHPLSVPSTPAPRAADSFVFAVLSTVTAVLVLTVAAFGLGYAAYVMGAGAFAVMTAPLVPLAALVLLTVVAAVRTLVDMWRSTQVMTPEHPAVRWAGLVLLGVVTQLTYVVLMRPLICAA